MKVIKLATVFLLSILCFKVFATEVVCGRGKDFNIDSAISELNYKLTRNSESVISAPVFYLATDAVRVCVSVNNK